MTDKQHPEPKGVIGPRTEKLEIQDPAAPAPQGAAPAAPAQVEVEVDGQKFLVDAAVAKALQSKKEEPAQVTSPAQPAAPAKPEDKKIEIDVERMFSDPAGFVSDLTDRIKREVRAESEHKSALDKAREVFWGKFYADHEDLKDADLVVKTVMTRDFNEISVMPVDKQQGEIAERTRKELIKLGVRREAKATAPAAIVEGGDTSLPPEAHGTPRVAASDVPASITAIMGKANEKRREARQRLGQGSSPATPTRRA